MMPILSTIMPIIIFNEKFMFYHMLGAAFILTGILLSNRNKKLI
jgi:drug/metabolite transporter (DMT)-like permease